MRLSRPELDKKYNIDENYWNTKHDIVMEHLSNYMEITELKEKNKYFYEIIGELPESIPPIPRKSRRVEA